jgi:hypothetical protein
MLLYYVKILGELNKNNRILLHDQIGFGEQGDFIGMSSQLLLGEVIF